MKFRYWTTLAIFSLLALIALNLHSRQAPAADMSGSLVAAAMMPIAPGSDAGPPSLVEPVLLCGNRWVTGTYVVGSNCQKACINRYHQSCTPALVAQCTKCWRALQACAGLNVQNKCSVCSARYAACMRGFL
jgi:uncharacterized membrane protein AbrB (regulator of aidB expression)